MCFCECASVTQVLYEGMKGSCFVFSINTCTNLIMHKLVVFEEAQGAMDNLEDYFYLAFRLLNMLNC